jgi:glycosyltransferase involved in cell wall biosynthesis
VRICMITTFYGAQSFGGDAAYVDRLVRALARRGHEIEVVHCADAFRAVRGDAPLMPFEPADRVVIHTLESPLGVLSPLWTHQTGRVGSKARPIRNLIEKGRFDVVHLHNVSLVGGPQLLALASRATSAVRLMTAHEYWLVCPMHVLWKLNRRPCEASDCIRCTLQGRRPPQLWRYTPMLTNALEHLDALICPSRFSVDTHTRLGIDRPKVHLPYFLPDDWASSARDHESNDQSERPYLLAVGRMVKLKGFQNLIPLMAQMPELDLRLAGVGPEERRLRRLAEGMPNVHFEGLLDSRRVAGLMDRAIALAVPSLSWETFGYVVLEAFAVGTPVIARRRGALPELIGESGGGLLFESDTEFVEAARRLAADHELRQELGRRGQEAVATTWSETEHLRQYFSLIDKVASRRGLRLDASSGVDRMGWLSQEPLLARK